MRIRWVHHRRRCTERESSVLSISRGSIDRLAYEFLSPLPMGDVPDGSLRCEGDSGVSREGKSKEGVAGDDEE